MRLKLLATAVALMSASLAARADIQYQVTVNTTSALLTYGYIDIQFNPSSFTTQAATAEVANFASDGVLNPADPGNGTTGAVSGMLPGDLTFENSQPNPNEYTEALTFGTTITLELDLSGPALDDPNGDGGGTFILDFLNSDQSGYLFTADSQNDVPVFTVTINGDGTTTAETYPSQDDGPPVVTFVSPTSVTPTPEPSTFLLLGTGLLGVAGAARKRFA